MSRTPVTVRVAGATDVPALRELWSDILRRGALDERPGQVRRHAGSTEKAERLLGWRARTSFEEGLARTVQWYRENEAWWRATQAASVSSS